MERKINLFFNIIEDKRLNLKDLQILINNFYNLFNIKEWKMFIIKNKEKLYKLLEILSNNRKVLKLLINNNLHTEEDKDDYIFIVSLYNLIKVKICSKCIIKNKKINKDCIYIN